MENHTFVDLIYFSGIIRGGLIVFSVPRGARGGVKPAMVLFYIDVIPKLNQTNRDGDTALIRAVVMKKEPLARYLIEQGANIHTSNLEKESAFVWALKHDMRPLILLLMEKGVLSNMPPDEGDDPFREILLKNPQLLLFLLNESPLNMRTCRSSLAGTIFDILHENPLPLLEGVSLSAEVSSGYEFDLLMAAVWTGREDLVARICEMSKNKGRISRKNLPKFLLYLYSRLLYW